MIWRQGTKYVVYHNMDRCFVWDATDDSVSGDLISTRYFAGNAIEWKLLLDDHETPDGLLKHLILKYRPK